MDSLPTETLSRVVSYLAKRHIEALAQTYNKNITPVCIPALSEWLATARNERIMIARFGKPRPWTTSEKMFARYPELGEYSPPSEEPVERLRVLDYLDLNGSLDWLQPLDEHAAKEMEPYEQGEVAASPEAMDEFKIACQKLGLNIPKGFELFMTDWDLQRRVPTATACSWEFNPLVKIVANEQTGWVDGYALHIYEDQQGCYHWYLYMDKNGGHCILADESEFLYMDEDIDLEEVEKSDTDDDDSDQTKHHRRELYKARTPAEKELGIMIAEEIDLKGMMLATSFEEFLVRHYFDEWASFIDKLPDPLKKYHVRVYTRKGRNMRYWN